MCRSETHYKLIHLDSVDSTNNYAKELLACAPDGADLPFVVAAESQTAGRGRLGRSFVSPEGTGIYMSVVLPASSLSVPLSLVTPAAAVATCHAIKEICDVSPQIKWVNDIYLNNKKICGILTETQTGSDSIIIGIGINCFPGSFPADVAEIAGCISDDVTSFDKDELLNAIANNVLDIVTAISNPGITCAASDPNKSVTSSEPAFLSEYRELCFILGKTVCVTAISSDEKYNATAVDIDRDGALIVERINDSGESETVRLISAEVSLHLD